MHFLNDHKHNARAQKIRKTNMADQHQHLVPAVKHGGGGMMVRASPVALEPASCCLDHDFLWVQNGSSTEPGTQTQQQIYHRMTKKRKE